MTGPMPNHDKAIRLLYDRRRILTRRRRLVGLTLLQELGIEAIDAEIDKLELEEEAFRRGDHD